MSVERSLFDDTVEMADLVRLVEHIADQKCVGYHVSWGMSKGAAGHKTYSAIVVLQTKQRKNDRQIFHGDSVRNLIEQTNDFLKTI